jgi:hypothetical protein
LVGAVVGVLYRHRLFLDELDAAAATLEAELAEDAAAS